MEVLHNSKDLEQQRKDLRKRMTRAEILLWSKLRAKQIGYKFRRQHSIGSFVVDFYCSACNLVIEIDGYSHADDQINKKDLIKEKYLNEKGFIVVHFEESEVLKGVDNILEQIWTVCGQAEGKSK